MASTTDKEELKTLSEKISEAEKSLSSLLTKAERIPEIVGSLEKLEARIRALEERKSQLDDLVSYKGISDTRIMGLEQTKWYYKGGLNTIAVLLVSSGILGIILGILLKGWFGP